MTVLTGDELEIAHAAAAEKALVAATKCTDLSNRKASVQQEIDQLQQKYETECQRLAAGDKDANPAAALSELDRRSHEFRGLEALLARAQAELDPLNMESRRLAEQLQKVQENRQVEELVAKQINLERAALDAEKNLQDARSALAVVTNELGDLRRRIERRWKQAA